MNLYKATGSIGGLTMVSRVLGLVREMVAARILGAGAAGDAFTLAFTVPNLFRRLFGEGAFSSGFVPLFSRRLHGEGGMEDAQSFAEEILAVFAPVLIAVTVVFVIAMPAFLWVLAPKWMANPAKFALAVQLTQITFPYLIFISLVSLLSGILNSLTRFTAAAFAPALLNVALVAALLIVPQGGAATARAMALGVLAGGVLQLLLLWGSVRRAGLKLKLLRPRVTPRVKELMILILPATLGSGIYYVSQFIYTFFATSLPDGSLVNLGQADRLNQLPLAIIGSALGTAILPAISRSVETGQEDAAASVQSQAAELAMLLTLPAAVALSIVAGPIVSVLFEAGRMTAEAARTTALVLSIIVTGLPAYVLIKVLTPGFYARKDVRTPVVVGVVALALGVLLNFILIAPLGIAALALTTALSAWVNCIVLYVILHRRGQFRVRRWLASRIARQCAAAILMGLALYFTKGALAAYFDGSDAKRVFGLAALVSVGGAVYFAAAFLFGGFDRNEVAMLMRRRRVVSAGPS